MHSKEGGSIFTCSYAHILHCKRRKISHFRGLTAKGWITDRRAELTGLPVLLVLPVQAVHSLQQLPLLTAARVVDEVAGEDLFELADGEVFYGLLVVQIGQRRSDPPLRRRADLKPQQDTRH